MDRLRSYNLIGLVIAEVQFPSLEVVRNMDVAIYASLVQEPFVSFTNLFYIAEVLLLHLMTSARLLYVIFTIPRAKAM